MSEHSRSTDFREKNLHFLRQHFPVLYETVRHWSRDSSNYKVSAAKSGEPILHLRREERWMPLYSGYNPRAETERWVKSLQLQPGASVVLFGLGLGYHVDALLKFCPGVQLHLFEPEREAFLAALEWMDFTRLDLTQVHSLAVFDPQNEDLQQATARFVQPLLRQLVDQSVVFQVMPTYRRLLPQQVELFEELSQQLVLAERVNLHAFRQFEKWWTLNVLRNMGFILQSSDVTVLKPLVEGKPMVITSSGPSLKEAIPLLKEVRDRVFILAAGSSVNGLLHHGLLPHAVISYDPHPNNRKIFELYASHGIGIPLIFGTTIHHDILAQQSFPQLFRALISQDTVTPHLLRIAGTAADTPVFHDAPSVASLAMQVAHCLGADPVILVGQDLAFPNDQFYTPGVSNLRRAKIDEAEKERRRYFKVEQVGGGQVLSSESMLDMRVNIEAFLRQFKKEREGSRFINTSPAGARIAGTHELSLDEALAPYMEKAPVDVDAEIARIGGFASPERALTAQMQQAFASLWSQLESLEKAVQELAVCVGNLASERRGERLERHFRQFDARYRQVASHDLYSLVVVPMVRTQLDLLQRTIRQVKDWPLRQKAESIAQRSAAFVHDCEKTLNMLKDLNKDVLAHV